MAKGLPPALTKTVKGLPVYVWLLLLASAIVITLYLRKRDTEDEYTEEPIAEETGFTPFPAPAGGASNGEIGAADLSSITDAIGGLSDDIGLGFDGVTEGLLGLGGQLDDAQSESMIEHAETLDAIREGQTSGAKGMTRKQVKRIAKRTAKKVARGDNRRLSTAERKQVRKVVQRQQQPKKRVAMTGGNPPRTYASKIDTRRIRTGGGW